MKASGLLLFLAASLVVDQAKAGYDYYYGDYYSSRSGSYYNDGTQVTYSGSAWGVNN